MTRADVILYGMFGVVLGITMILLDYFYVQMIPGGMY